jgi:hypothetical protein
MKHVTRRPKKKQKKPIGRFENRVYETGEKIQTSNLPRFAYR